MPIHSPDTCEQVTWTRQAGFNVDRTAEPKDGERTLVIQVDPIAPKSGREAEERVREDSEDESTPRHSVLLALKMEERDQEPIGNLPERQGMDSH